MWKKQWFTGIVQGLVGSAIFAILIYAFGWINIIPKIESTNAKIDSLAYSVNDLKLCIKSDKNKGRLLKVGVSSELIGNQISCYSTNINDFDQYDRITLRFEGNRLKSNPQVEVQIFNIETISKTDNRIFVSKEIANQLGIPLDKISDVYFKIIDKSS
jgi:hypothetical protein